MTANEIKALLKSYFETGNRPTETEFAEWIDYMVASKTPTFKAIEILSAIEYETIPVIDLEPEVVYLIKGEPISGIETLVSGTTSIAIAHTLANTPSVSRFVILPIDDMGNATKWWIGNITATHFTIYVDVNPASDIQFSWRIL